MTARRRPAQPSDPAASPSDDTQAVPRSARNGQPSSTVPFTGFALVPVEDGKPPKMIPADATIGLKVELLGWPKIEGVGAYTCKSKTPIDVLKNTDHTPDGLHRMYGACSVQVQAWTLSATGNLEKPIQAKVWHFEPCVFDEPEDTDPEYEDEDVGTEKWAIGESWLAADQTLKKELARRTKVRRELDRGGEEYDEEEEEGDGRPPRGRGRGPSRGGPRRDWGTQARGGGGRPRGGADDVPDGMFDPDWTPPEPPPDMKWAWDGRTNQWRQYPKGSGPSAPVVAEKAPGFLDSPSGATVLAAAITTLGAIAQKMLEPKPDPMANFMTMWATMQGPKADPVALKQLELTAEEAREKREMAARVAAAESEKTRREHEINLERERARLTQEREDQLFARKAAGLIPPDGPTPAQVAAQTAAQIELATMRMRVEMMEKAPKAQSDLEVFEKIKGTLSKFGVKVGEGETGSLADMMDTPAAKAMAEGLAPALGAVLMRFAGAAAPAPAPIVAPAPIIQAPDPRALMEVTTQIEQKVLAAREQGRQDVADYYAQQAAQQAPQAIPGVPPAPQMDAPTEPPPATVWPPPAAVEPPVEVDPRVAYEQRLAAEEAEREAWRIANAAPQAPTEEAHEAAETVTQQSEQPATEEGTTTP